MKLIRVADAAQAGKVAAEIIAQKIKSCPDCVLGLATGSTPIETYNNLVQMYRQGSVDFSRVRGVNLDEYIGLGAEHDQSYAWFMRQYLFDHVNIDPAYTYIPNGLETDSDKECRRYDAVIESLGGIDLQLLGIGPNGHIGFNEPADTFAKGTHRVDLTEATIAANSRFFESIDQVPKQAYSMGIQNIMHARQLLMVATGENKARAVRDAFRGAITPWVPASVLQLHPDFTLIADEAALSLVSGIVQ